MTPSPFGGCKPSLYGTGEIAVTTSGGEDRQHRIARFCFGNSRPAVRVSSGRGRAPLRAVSIAVRQGSFHHTGPAVSARVARAPAPFPPKRTCVPARVLRFGGVRNSHLADTTTANGYIMRMSLVTVLTKSVLRCDTSVAVLSGSSVTCLGGVAARSPAAVSLATSPSSPGNWLARASRPTASRRRGSRPNTSAKWAVLRRCDRC